MNLADKKAQLAAQNEFYATTLGGDPAETSYVARDAQTASCEQQKPNSDSRRPHPFLKLDANPKSLRLAINAMCCDCQGGSREQMPDPGWQWAIGNCVSRQCPLFKVRPYQNKLGQPPEGVYRDADDQK